MTSAISNPSQLHSITKQRLNLSIAKAITTQVLCLRIGYHSYEEAYAAIAIVEEGLQKLSNRLSLLLAQNVDISKYPRLNRYDFDGFGWRALRTNLDFDMTDPKRLNDFGGLLPDYTQPQNLTVYEHSRIGELTQSIADYILFLENFFRVAFPDQKAIRLCNTIHNCIAVFQCRMVNVMLSEYPNLKFDCSIAKKISPATYTYHRTKRKDYIFLENSFLNRFTEFISSELSMLSPGTITACPSFKTPATTKKYSKLNSPLLPYLLALSPEFKEFRKMLPMQKLIIAKPKSIDEFLAQATGEADNR